MYDDVGPWWGKRGLVEVKDSFKLCVGREFGVELGWDGRSKLRVSSTWSRSRHQLERGKFGSVVGRPEMKWFLKVQMVDSV